MVRHQSHHRGCGAACCLLISNGTAVHAVHRYAQDHIYRDIIHVLGNSSIDEYCEGWRHKEEDVKWGDEMLLAALATQLNVSFWCSPWTTRNPGW